MVTALLVLVAVAWGDVGGGMSSYTSIHDVPTTLAILVESVEQRGLGLALVWDHKEKAAEVGLELRNTTVVLFGNPAVGTLLMQTSRVVGIDLPLKMTIMEGPDGGTAAAYTTAEAYRDRFPLEGREEQLEAITGALASLAAEASNSSAPDVSVPPTPYHTNGVLTAPGPFSGEQALVLLLEDVARRGLELGTVVDHSSAAAGVGLSLPFTSLAVFGSATLGTPLMQAAQSLSIDLPMKMLVWEEGAVTYVSRPDLNFYRLRFGLTGEEHDETFTTMAGALGAIARAATVAGNALMRYQSDATVDETVERLKAAIANTGAVSVVRVVDHTENAARDGVTIRNTTVVLFGNPSLGTQLMLSNRRIALELPLRNVVWEDESATVHLAYTSVEALRYRFQIHDRDAEFEQMSGALHAFASAAANSTGGERMPAAPVEGDAVVTVESADPAHVVLARVRDEIAALGFVDVQVVDHAAAAAAVGLVLPFTSLVLVEGIPAAHRVLQDSQDFGVELPLKLLVWEHEGGSSISYTNVDHWRRRFSLTSGALDEDFAIIADALHSIAHAASSPAGDDGLTTLAKVGIALGCIAAVSIVIGAFVLHRRSHRAPSTGEGVPLVANHHK